MKQAKIIYYLSEEGRKNLLLAGGNGEKHQVSFGDFTKDNKDLFKVDSDGNIRLNLQESKLINITGVSLRSYNNEISYDEKHDTPWFDDIQSFEDLIKFEKERIKKIELQKKELEGRYNELLVEQEENRIKIEEKKKKEVEESEKRARVIQEEEEKRLERKAKKEEASKKKKQEEKEFMLSWIEEFGSNHLKDTVKLGYEYKKTFVYEYTDKELPGFDFDFDDYYYKERTSPSEKAINELKNLIELGYDACILWDSIDKVETIKIEYMGYCLTKTIEE